MRPSRQTLTRLAAAAVTSFAIIAPVPAATASSIRFNRARS